MEKRIHRKGTLKLEDILKKIKKNPDFTKAGAIGIFIGVVRGERSKEEKVKKLKLEAYEEKADELLGKICTDLKKNKGIIDVQIHHLIGEFDVNDDLVYVLIASSHRKNMFLILEEAINRYKKEAPIFKKEYISDGKKEKSYWVTEVGK
jgi:molybdopterin synthase catalytic subunit